MPIVLLRIFAVIALCRFASAFLEQPQARRGLFAQSLARAQTSNDQAETELIDVAIIGGGPTGLSCALALLRASSSSSFPPPSMAIFESDTFQPKGATVIITSPGWKALNCIDKETYKEAKAEGAWVSVVDFKDFSGKPLLPRLVKFAMRRLARPILRLLRRGIVRANNWHAFRGSLRRGVQRVGSELGYSVDDLIRTNTSLISIDPASKTDRVLLTFSDGTEVAASAVLACDGTFSTVRKSLDRFENQRSNGSNDGKKPVLINEGKTVFRGTAPNIAPHGIATFYATVGVTGCVFPAGRTTDGSALSVIMPTSVGGRAVDTDDTRTRLKEALAKLNAPIDKDLMEVIDDVDNMIEHKLYSRDVVTYPNLASGYDRIAYFGDAAHPLRPTGEGVAVAMEDAWTIGHLVGTSEKGVISPGLFRKYENERQGRVNAICKAVRDLAESYYDENNQENMNDEDKEKKEIQTNNNGVKQAMKDHPIKLSSL
jgi:2-polyprenyl-6-methoxyphenol hydroxylase-like FAD-dependent oxidoreductase